MKTKPPRTGEPPVVWTCLHCGSRLTSKYAKKTHACSGTRSEKGLQTND